MIEQVVAETDGVATKLRLGLRRLAKAVVVVTSRKNGLRAAMAATAVSELSMAPPSLLICVNRNASLYPMLATGANFCVNILHAGHSDISAACGGKAKGEARFDLGQWGSGPGGMPYLTDAQASFFCRNDRSIDYGTHGIMIGEVVEVFVEGEVDPLIYVDGGYTRAVF